MSRYRVTMLDQPLRQPVEVGVQLVPTTVEAAALEGGEGGGGAGLEGELFWVDNEASVLDVFPGPNTYVAQLRGVTGSITWEVISEYAGQITHSSTEDTFTVELLDSETGRIYVFAKRSSTSMLACYLSVFGH